MKKENKELLNELNNERKKIEELKNKIKLLENSSSNENINKIKELQQLVNFQNNELNELKSKLIKDDSLEVYKKGEKIVAINFESLDQVIKYPIACENTDIMVRLEEKLYNEYPKYKDYNTFLTINGKIIKRFKNLDENEIMNGDSIIVNIYNE